MLSAETLSTIKSIAPAVALHAETLTRNFYERMFRENPEVRAFFNAAHQHSGGQQRALAGAIVAYFSNIDRVFALQSALELIAQKHCSLQIKAEHYPIVGKHLLNAVKEVFAEAATPAVLGAIGEAYQMLADLLIAREQQIYDQQKKEFGWNGYRSFVVVRKEIESDLVKSLYLSPEDGKALPPFKAGQYITLAAKLPGVSTSPRNYSLSDAPHSKLWRISVKRERNPSPTGPHGLVSNHIHDHVQVGDVLAVGAPCGEFVLNAEAEAATRPVLLIAGGIGITPLMAMAKDLLSRSHQAPVYFIQAAKNSRVQAFGRELKGLKEKYETLHCVTVFDDPSSDDLELGHCQRVGCVTRDLLLEFPLHEAEIYFCGPAGFMRSVYATLRELGVQEARMHFEFFGPRQEIA